MSLSPLPSEEPKRKTSTSPRGSTLHKATLAKKGVESAWERLIAKIGEELDHNSKFRDLPPGHEWEDLYQEVCAEVFQSIGNFRTNEDSNFRAWVRTIAENRLQTLWRRKRAKKRDATEQPLSGSGFPL